MKMSRRRCTSLPNAFSKKIANHGPALSLDVVFYHVMKMQKTLRVTPAMEAGLMDRVGYGQTC